MRPHVVVAALLLQFGVARSAPAEPVLQEPRSAEPERMANNTIYAEVGGPGLFYSVNYERRFGDAAARIGLGYLAVGSQTASSSTTAASSRTDSFVALPVTVSYLGIGSRKDMFELGAGLSLYHRGSGVFGRGLDAATTLMPNALAGYRHQLPGGGFVFRIGLSLLVETERQHFSLPEPILPWPYLALGGAFG